MTKSRGVQREHRDWTELEFRLLIRAVWEAAHGPIPSGHKVWFKPGQKTTDPAAITLDSVELLSFAQSLARNSIHNLPKELVTLVQLRGALNRQINKRSKKA